MRFTPEFWSPRRILWSILFVAVLAAVSAVWLFQPASRISARSYTIGWTVSPPFLIRGDDGKAAGMVADLVDEAARRRGIRLKWTFHDESSDNALRNKAVDLWAFTSITPERRKEFYITEPFMVTEHSMLVRADSRYRTVQDLSTAAIETSKSRIDYRILQNLLPDAHILMRSTTRIMLDEICQKKADAAFTDAYAGIAALLEQSGSCADQALRWIPTPVRVALGIGASFDNRAVADQLREEIGVMARDGSLRSIRGRQTYFSTQQMESVEELVEARERYVRLAAAAVMFGLLITMTCWLWLRAAQERGRAARAEMALAGTERRLHLLADSLREMVLAFNMEGRLIYANPAVEVVSGYSGRDLEAQGPPDWFHPDDRDRMLAARKSLFQGGLIQQEEYRLITRRGEVKWASANWAPILDETGRQIGIQGNESDITQRKLAEKSLRESERRLRSLLENVRIVAAMCDREGNYVFCNDYFLETLGRLQEEMAGHSILEFAAPEYRQQAAQFLDLWTRTAQPETWSDEAVLMTKSGQRRWLQANSVALRDSDGVVTGFASLAIDLTAHRALQAQYLQAQKLEGIGRLAGGVAHDFNNLLTVINGYSEVVLGATDEADPRRASLLQIHYAGQRAAELTQQLLMFSRRTIARLAAVNVNELICGSEKMFRALVGEDIRWSITLDVQEPFVKADSGQIHQVLMNLIVNARDAMPNGGEIGISVSTTEVDPMSMECPPGLAAGPYVMIRVSDSGTGMSEETKQRVFEPFFSTKGAAGTGLGLSTVHGIVHQNAGGIQMRSELGKGTSFDVYLPRIEASIPNISSAASFPAGQRRAEVTVMVAEDDNDVRSFAVTALESCGYQVMQACSGEEALKLAKANSEPIDVLMTDVVMGGMNGRVLAEHLTVVHPETRVLFTSGYTSDEIARRGVAEGRIAFLQKPYSVTMLCAKVLELLEIHA